MTLCDGPAAPGSASPRVQGTIVERAYLGEFWDYIVSPQGSGLKLRVTAPPLQIHQVGEPVWLEFDPKQMAAIS